MECISVLYMELVCSISVVYLIFGYECEGSFYCLLGFQKEGQNSEQGS